MSDFVESLNCVAKALFLLKNSRWLLHISGGRSEHSPSKKLERTRGLERENVLELKQAL